uniref:GST C-terminal domain-containing protein n=1 Tax=Quercus lobata TaxID=97700 RepID=A0A7N2L295_QUELO
MGNNPLYASQIDCARCLIEHWIDFPSLEIDTNILACNKPRIECAIYLPLAEEAAISSLKRVLDALDTHLASNTLLVGNSVILADIVTMCNLYMGFTQLMTNSFISKFPCGKLLLDHGESTKFQEVSGRGEKDKSVLPVTKKHLSQKNLLNQSLRMNPKRRNQQSRNQNLVRKRRLQS